MPKLLAALIATALCTGFANAAALNEWLFDATPTHPTGTPPNQLAVNEIAGGTTIAELNLFVSYQNLQVNGGPFVSTVGGQALFLSTVPSGGQANYAGQGVGTYVNWGGKTAITVEAWVNPTSGITGTRDVVFDGGNGIRLISTSGGYNMQGIIYNGTYNTTSTGSLLIPYDTWTHVAMTYDGSTMRTYVGQTLDTSNMRSITTTLATNNSAFIGEFSSANFFKGYIDEIRSSDVALLPGDGSGNGTLAWNASLAAVPEPGTIALALTAAGGFVCLRLLRRRRS